jgi:hypothetical protein
LRANEYREYSEREGGKSKTARNQRGLVNVGVLNIIATMSYA